MAFVGQVRAIFQPQVRRTSQLPEFLSVPLVYVDIFDWVVKGEVMGLWIVERRMVPGPNGLRRASAILSLVNTSLAVELILVYGKKVIDMVDSKTLQEVYSRFYLNSYTDKETFHSLDTEL